MPRQDTDTILCGGSVNIPDRPATYTLVGARTIQRRFWPLAGAALQVCSVRAREGGDVRSSRFFSLSYVALKV